MSITKLVPLAALLLLSACATQQHRGMAADAKGCPMMQNGKPMAMNGGMDQDGMGKGGMQMGGDMKEMKDRMAAKGMEGCPMMHKHDGQGDAHHHPAS